jgi:hypothetical protein
MVSRDRLYNIGSENIPPNIGIAYSQAGPHDLQRCAQTLICDAAPSSAEQKN